MKSKIMMLSFVLIAMSLGTVGCKKETPAPAPAPTPAPAPAPTVKTTGKVTAKVRLKGTTTFVTEASVEVYTSLENFENEIILKEVKVNSSGSANLGELAPGGYYIWAGTPDFEYQGYKQIQVVANIDQDIIIDIE